MNKKSLVMMLVTICLIGVVGVGATMAYLSDTADQLTNTFTLGKVDIELKEPNWEEPDVVVPGQEIAKDPTVTVAANSVDSYVFMSVSGIDAMEDAGFEINGFSAAWKNVDADSEDADGIYVYVDAEGKPAVVAKSDAATVLPSLFTSVTYDKDNDSNVGGEFNILVKAAAVQADEIEYADALAEVAEGLAFNNSTN